MNHPILSKNVIKKLFSNIGLKLARACPNFRPILLKNYFDSPPQFNGEFPSYLMGSFRRISLKIFSTSYILKNIVYIKGEVWKLQD